MGLWSTKTLYKYKRATDHRHVLLLKFATQARINELINAAHCFVKMSVYICVCVCVHVYVSVNDKKVRHRSKTRGRKRNGQSSYTLPVILCLLFARCTELSQCRVFMSMSFFCHKSVWDSEGSENEFHCIDDEVCVCWDCSMCFSYGRECVCTCGRCINETPKVVPSIEFIWTLNREKKKANKMEGNSKRRK